MRAGGLFKMTGESTERTLFQRNFLVSFPRMIRISP